MILLLVLLLPGRWNIFDSDHLLLLMSLLTGKAHPQAALVWQYWIEQGVVAFVSTVISELSQVLIQLRCLRLLRVIGGARLGRQRCGRNDRCWWLGWKDGMDAARRGSLVECIRVVVFFFRPKVRRRTQAPLHHLQIPILFYLYRQAYLVGLLVLNLGICHLPNEFWWSDHHRRLTPSMVFQIDNGCGGIGNNLSRVASVIITSLVRRLNRLHLNFFDMTIRDIRVVILFSRVILMKDNVVGVLAQSRLPFVI